MRDTRWTSDEDTVLSKAWNKDNIRGVCELLAQRLDRSWQAIQTRFYALGFRKYAPEERAVLKQRAVHRRVAIDEVLLNGRPRRPVAKRLGISECMFNIRRGDLLWQGLEIPSVPWWQYDRETNAEATATIARTAYLEYRDTMHDIGMICKCHHKEGLHIDGICTHYDKRGEGCECIEFVPFNVHRKKGQGLTDVMGYRGGNICILVPPIELRSLGEAWQIDTQRKYKLFELKTMTLERMDQDE